MTSRRNFRGLGVLLLLQTSLLISGCSSFGSSGPGTGTVKSAARNDPAIKVVDATEGVARSLMAARKQVSFGEALGDAAPVGSIVGPGDVLDISIWEAPPAALFGATAVDARLSMAPTVARSSEIPQQMVDADGRIVVPFVGYINVAGLSPIAISRAIVARLQGRAHQPQVVVRIAENQTANATIVGDVANSRRIPLTTKGERLLDALAAAGGVRQPVEKTTIQVTRGDQVVREPLSALIRQPRDNIRLAANDVVTALFQPYSFQALGAFGTNAEVNFEGTGLTLAQALGRVGGLQDNRADIKGVFIFRFENPAALPAGTIAGGPTTLDGKVPVIYRVDLSNPATFFVAQGFPIDDKDVLYVSNAPAVDLQKFVNVASQMAFSVVGISNAVQ